MEISVLAKDPKVLIEVEGRLDTINSPVFQKVILDALEENKKDMVIECSKLSFVSSSGLRALLLLAKNADNYGAEITLTHLTEIVREVLEVSSIEEFFNIEE